MTSYDYDNAELSALKGKTILIFGAATGIGLATVQLAHSYGANIAIGDWNESQGNELATQLKERVSFKKCDVSQWDDVLDTFQAAHEKFGTIHAVLANAGINKEDFLKDQIDEKSGRLQAPDLNTIHVNLVGAIYIAKCTAHYAAKWPESRTHLVMTGSAASYIDTPPLHLYCASKAGILGLMRGLRTQLISKNITVNMVAPWFTLTPMLPQWIIDIWGNLPANDTEGVGRALLLPIIRPELNGKSFFVAGRNIVEVEDKIHECQPVWLGTELSEQVDEGQRRMTPGWEKTVLAYRK